MSWALVAVAGGAGATVRHAVDRFVATRARPPFPFGIFIVNVSGSFLLGLLVGAAASGWTLQLLGTAFLGSYTTFSTWMLDTDRLARDHPPRHAFLNLALPQTVGLLAAALGWWLGSL